MCVGPLIGKQGVRTCYIPAFMNCRREDLNVPGADASFFIRGDRNFSSTHAVQLGLQNYGDKYLPHFSRVGSFFRLSTRLNWSSKQLQGSYSCLENDNIFPDLYSIFTDPCQTKHNDRQRVFSVFRN